MVTKQKILIVGAGISGATAARLLHDAGHEVEISDCRNHIGGNCYDERVGEVTMHKYGPHLFHTNDEGVWRFLSRFTEWTDYEHRVVADTTLGRISIPYSKKTESQLGKKLSDEEIRKLIFVDYSEKQWGVTWDELPAAITNRVPAKRENADERYFTDRFQGQPAEGYAVLFENMLDGIKVETGVERDAWRQVKNQYDLLIYTGKVDEYFDYSLGRLPYRSLRFEHEISKTRLPHAVINQCNQLPFTRIYDHAYFSGENPHQTIITKEFPESHNHNNEPYYPMPFGEGMDLFQKYKALCKEEHKTIFLGRLATYSYLDMWMAVAQVMVKLKQYKLMQTL